MAGKNNRDKVAALAGVSSATVSRVYNNPDRVSPEKKEAVLKAAGQLGYSPDKSASALRRSGTGQISLVSFEKKGRPWYWGDFPGAKWFFTDVLSGVLSVVDSSMYRLNLKTLKSPEEAASINWKQECDGILFFDVDSDEEARVIAELPVPSVISHHSSHFENIHRCSTDNTEGGRLAAAHLKDSGYDRAAYISYLPDLIIPNRDRYSGFCTGFGREVPLYLTDPGKEGGYRICETLLPEIKSGQIDSVAVVNDMTAIGVIQCLQDNGLRPGRDLGLMGYDNMPFNYALPFS
ncbi:MAG: LacI family DNA-binding transcriptional regulator, partial [Spirochaetales bacterium]|nr:LacI family DNA-binding transcriptional regulator [Spirochaetales bacterium]